MSTYRTNSRAARLIRLLQSFSQSTDDRLKAENARLKDDLVLRDFVIAKLESDLEALRKEAHK